MSLITRTDGTAFVLRCYRERFIDKSLSQVKRDCRMLAKTNGHYLRIIKLRNHQWEAIFSNQPGFLLAEILWHHFGRIDNLLFCEQREDGLIFVLIVKRGVIFFDALLTQSELLQELPPLMSDECSYHVKIFGDVPISNQPQAQQYFLSPTQVLSFDNLSQPLIELIKPLEKYRLLPLDYALTKVNSFEYPPVILGIVALIAVFMWYWPQTLEHDVTPPPTPAEIAQDFLASPNPQQLLARMQYFLLKAYSIPGWMVSRLHYQQNQTDIVMHSLGAPTGWLLDWAENRHYLLALNQEGAVLQIPTTMTNRPDNPALLSTTRTLSLLIDRMMQIIPEKTVTVKEMRTTPFFHYTDVDLQFSQISPQVFDIISRMLSGLAIKLQQVDLNVNNGLLSGTIKLTVIGS